MDPRILGAYVIAAYALGKIWLLKRMIRRNNDQAREVAKNAMSAFDASMLELVKRGKLSGLPEPVSAKAEKWAEGLRKLSDDCDSMPPEMTEPLPEIPCTIPGLTEREARYFMRLITLASGTEDTAYTFPLYRNFTDILGHQRTDVESMARKGQ